MKKTQFTVVYTTIQYKESRFSGGIDVEIDENQPALENHTRLLKAIVEFHNSQKQLTEAIGTIKSENIILFNVVRLN